MEVDAKLQEAAVALCADVSGIDWDAGAVQADVTKLMEAAREASNEGRAAALDTLVERLRISRLEDADGVAHVAISAGTLVECGGSPRALAEVLLAKLPEVLEAARRYADTCLKDLPPPDEDVEEKGILYVDDRGISLDLFREHLAEDRPGACALRRLRQWVLPAIAALIRDREMLVRACKDGELGRRAEALDSSDAHWLHVLLGVELDARWLVLAPIEERGFHIIVDGVTRNFEMHTLVASALIERGVAGTRPPDALVAFLEGRSERGVDHVEGVWNYYDWTAARYDLASDDVPLDHWVWNEGSPRDVPLFDGMRTLLIGPASIERTWNVGRIFGELATSVRVESELSPEQVRAHIDAMKARQDRPSQGDGTDVH